MRLRHAAQHNIAKQGTYRSSLRPHTVASGHDLHVARKQLVLTTIERLVTIANCSNNYEPSELSHSNHIRNHHHQAFEDACGEYDYGVAKSCCVRTLSSWMCFDTWFWLVRYGVRLTQSAHLLDAAEFSQIVAHWLKLQISLQISCLIVEFCRIWLPKRLKSCPFQKSNSAKLVGDASFRASDNTSSWFNK